MFNVRALSWLELEWIFLSKPRPWQPPPLLRTAQSSPRKVRFGALTQRTALDIWPLNQPIPYTLPFPEEKVES